MTEGPSDIHQNEMQKETFLHEKATVFVSELSSGKLKVRVQKNDPNYFVRWDECETSYPIDLIKQIFELKGPGWLCDEIAREESPHYTGAALKWQLLSYVDKDRFEKSRILDFGCGSGSSTTCLSRMFPSATIIGVEIEKEFLAVAEARARHYQLTNVDFIHSEEPDSLPADLGLFDYIVMTGVFEHLLPKERLELMPELWSLLNSGGVLFLHETPNRLFPIETHTTDGLPLINYMPESIALPFATKVSKRNLSNDSWATLLRKGIRGGTVNEITNTLKDGGRTVELLDPSMPGIQDRVDLWYASAEKKSRSHSKKIAYKALKILKRISGVELLPYLELAYRKK